MVIACALGWTGCGDVKLIKVDSGPGDAQDPVDAFVAVDADPDAPADASSDAPPSPIDAPIDGPPPVIGYDVAYVDEITFSATTMAINNFVAIVARGSQPLRLSTVAVVSVSDDRNDIEWTFERKTMSTVTLNPSRAAGALSNLARESLVNSGIVTEPFDDQILSFGMAFPTQPPLGTTLKAQAVIQIEALSVTLPFTIRISDGASNVFNHARRIPAQP